MRGQDHFCSGRDHFLGVDKGLLVAKITFEVAEVTFKVAVITSSVAKITFVVAEITLRVAVITFVVAKITFTVADRQDYIFIIFHMIYIRFLLNIALILLDVHYFDAESSEKNQLLQANCPKLLIFFRKQMAAILYFVIFHMISVFC